MKGDKLLFEKGDIIFGKRRAYQRKVVVTEFAGICSAHAMVLRPRAENIEPSFLPVFMQSDLFMERAMEISVGSLSPTINWKTLREQTFRLPSRKTQSRIAQLVWATNEAQQKWHAVYVDAVQSLQAMIEEFVLHGVAPAKSTKSPWGSIPSDWRVGKLGEVTSECRDKNQELRLGREHILRVSNADGFTRNAERVPESVDLSKYKIVEFGDFGYNPMRLNIGSIALLRDADPGLVSPDYVAFRCSEDLVPDYLEFFRRSALWRAHIQSSGKGSIRTRYYYADIANFQLPIPPIANQLEIVDVLSQQQQAIDAADRKHDALIELRRSLLSELLTGGHNV